MTPRSAAERGPRTAAGRALLDELVNRAGKPNERLLREQILAIEAAAPTAADAWQAGYEACWNRLRDAGRLLPSDAAEAARREAAAIAVLRAMTDHPWSFATDPDGDCFFCDNPCAGEDEQADHDAANPECPTTIARALLHDNAGTTAPAEGTP